MNNRIRRLFFMAVLTAGGLLCLQVFWIYKEWSRSRDLLQRQIDYSFQQAVDKEWKGRKDRLAAHLSGFLHDSSFVKFGTKYSEKEKTWMSILYDPANPKDYFSWSNKIHPVSEHLSHEELEGVINRFIEDNLRKSIASDIIFYFTQRFGKVWTEKHDELKLDTSTLKHLLSDELKNNDIDAVFSISYLDTIRTGLRKMKGDALYSRPVLVNMNQINDPEKRYVAVATVRDPGLVILKRLWLIGAGSLLLVCLTFWCLFSMYKTIVWQKQLARLKDDFISNVTHELKTPIATVIAAIDGLQFYDALNNKQRTQRYLDISRNELNRLDGMVTKALELSVEQNNQLNRVRFALRPFLEQLLADFEVQSGFSWVVSMDPEIMVCADRELLISLFLNLVDNAIKYNKGNTAMHFSAENASGFLKINIADNGPGIDKTYLPFLFNKFYRAPGVSEVKGFGLGLYRVAAIVKAHGGTISPMNNKGLHFTINLPAS